MPVDTFMSYNLMKNLPGKLTIGGCFYFLIHKVPKMNEPEDQLMTETSNCTDGDEADDDGDYVAADCDASALQTELVPEPLTIMKARWSC